MDYKDKVVNAEVILPDGYSIGGTGLPSQSFKLYTEDTATIKLSGNGEKATPLKGVVVVAEDENNALQAGDNGLAVKVSPAANNLLELKQGALYVTAPEINIPISPKEGNALTNLTSEGEEGLYVAPTKVQGWLYDSAPGVAALPGAFGYGMTDPGAISLIANSLGDVARSAHNLHPGRYYTFTTKSEEMTGITEIIWMDNGWGNKTSQTATKLVLFFGKDGRMKYTIRGDNLGEPAVWYDLLTTKQTDIYDRTKGVVAIPGAFGFGAILTSTKNFSGNSGTSEFLTWVKAATPGVYQVSQFAGEDKIIPGVVFNGLIEIKYISSSRNSSGPQYEEKGIFFFGVNGDFWYNRYHTTGSGNLIGWENLKVDVEGLRRFISLKADLDGPVFTGTPQSPTPSDSAIGTQIANVEFVKKQISNNTYTLSAGTVTVLDSGSQPTIEITGQSPSQVLNLGIPKAPDGQTIKSVNAVVKEIDSAQQVTLTFTMTDDSSQQASFNIPFSPQPTMKLSATSGNFSFNYSDTPSAKNAAGRSGSSIYLKTTVDLNRASAGSTDVMVDVRLTEIPCTEDGTYLDYDIYAEYPSVVGSGQPTVAVWLILPTVPTHTIDPKTKTITKLLRGNGLSGLNGIIPIASADDSVHEFKYFLQYSYLNN